MAAPDHNPQEQVWEATQRVVSHNHGQRDLTKLAHRFELHLKEHSFASALLDTYDHPRICATYS